NSQKPSANDVEQQTNVQLISATSYIYGLAVEAGDTELVKALIWSSDDPDRKVAGATAKHMVACYSLYHNLNLKFDGSDTAKVLMDYGIDPLDFLAMVSAKWKVQGDAAISEDPPPDRLKVSFRQIKGIRKIDLSHSHGQESADAAAARLN